MDKLVKNIIDSLNPPKNIKIIIDTNLPKIKTYKVMITQVLLNLLSNAGRIMPGINPNKPSGNENELDPVVIT